MRKLKLFSAIFTIVILLGGVIFSIVYFTQKDRQASIVVTNYVLYDICTEIMGNDDDILLLQDNGADMHNYSPTASDIATIASAELFVYIGGESDEWVSNVIRSIDSINLRTLSVMDIEGLNKLEESSDNILESEHDHNHEHEDEIVYDEHVRLSIKNVIAMTRSLRDNLTLVFPERQKLFKINSEEFIDKLQALDYEYTSKLYGAEQTLIIADRFPFRYLVNDYNLDYYAIFSGCSAETEASTATIAKLIDKINSCDVNYILVLETSDKSIAQSCINAHNCKEGVKILVINSCQAVSQSTMHSTSYLKIMTENLEILEKALDL